MAVLSKDELMTKIRSILKERTDDEAISLIEDVDDTFSARTENEKTKEDWEEEIRNIEENWRKKYMDRFFNKSVEKEVIEKEVTPETAEEKETTIEDLFTESEVK